MEGTLPETTLRHGCLMCGRSCQGIHIPILGEDEAARIAQIASRLGVTEPIVDGKLRLDGGACVFLGADGLCGVHREAGFAAKPTVCRQYPLVALRTESGVRVGVDPSCYTAITTWRDGPAVPEQSLTASRVALEPGDAAQEASLLDLVGQPGQTVAGIARALLGAPDPGDGSLPPGLAARIVNRLHAADLRGLLGREGTAPALRSTLGPLADAAPGWSTEAPPAWPAIEPDEDAWAVEVVRRMLFLRLAPTLPSPATNALLTLVGAIAVGWATHDPTAYGAGLSGWVRAIRAPMVWSALVPDAPTLAWLATGR
jgi:Fe-S-cluster containining protein